jgi:hypothetical protein
MRRCSGHRFSPIGKIDATEMMDSALYSFDVVSEVLNRHGEGSFSLYVAYFKPQLRYLVSSLIVSNGLFANLKCPPKDRVSANYLMPSDQVNNCLQLCH